MPYTLLCGLPSVLLLESVAANAFALKEVHSTHANGAQKLGRKNDVQLSDLSST